MNGNPDFLKNIGSFGSSVAGNNEKGQSERETPEILPFFMSKRQGKDVDVRMAFRLGLGRRRYEGRRPFEYPTGLLD